jgi:hypothetical protein
MDTPQNAIKSHSSQCIRLSPLFTDAFPCSRRVRPMLLPTTRARYHKT